jgi:uncharacterized protein (TIGR02217 family)
MATAHAFLKQDGDVLLLESNQEAERSFLTIADLPTAVALESEESKASAVPTYDDATSTQSTTPAVSIVLNHHGGANDGDPILMNGVSSSAARTENFNDAAVFPRDVGRGIGGGPGFKTVIQEVADGTEFRISKWQRPLRMFSVSTAVSTPDDFVKIMRFYRNVRGSLHGFRLRDPFDWSTAPTHMSEPDPTNYAHRHVIGAGDGSTVTYQLVKRYQTNGTLERFRPITRPTHPAANRLFTSKSENHVCAIFLDGALQTEGTHYSVARAGGEVEFASAPAVGKCVEWCGTFDVPVRFNEEVDQGLFGNFQTTESYNLPSLTCTEINEGVHFSDHKWMGGIRQQTITEDLQVYLGGGSTWFITASSGSLKVYLPDTAALCDGGPMLTIKNAGASNNFSIHKNTAGAYDAVVSTVTPGSHATFYVGNAGEYIAIQ